MTFLCQNSKVSEYYLELRPTGEECFKEGDFTLQHSQNVVADRPSPEASWQNVAMKSARKVYFARQPSVMN